MSSTTSEATLDRILVRECKRRGVACIRMTGDAGIPDRLIVVRGWHIWTELKTDDGRVSSDQRAYHAMLRRHGAYVMVARGRTGLSDVLATIDAHLANGGGR